MPGTWNERRRPMPPRRGRPALKGNADAPVPACVNAFTSHAMAWRDTGAGTSGPLSPRNQKTRAFSRPRTLQNGADLLGPARNQSGDVRPGAAAVEAHAPCRGRAAAADEVRVAASAPRRGRAAARGPRRRRRSGPWSRRAPPSARRPSRGPAAGRPLRRRGRLQRKGPPPPERDGALEPLAALVARVVLGPWTVAEERVEAPVRRQPRPPRETQVPLANHVRSVARARKRSPSVTSRSSRPVGC